jgi:hypothetical protein
VSTEVGRVSRGRVGSELGMLLLVAAMVLLGAAGMLVMLG